MKTTMDLPDQLRLRPATNEDMSWLEQLRRSVYQDLFHATWGAWDEERQERQFRECWSRGQIAVIEVDNTPVGMIQLFDKPDAVEVAEIQILPSHQNLGLGTSVMTGAVALAHRRGKRITLSVGLKNERALQFYQRLGFRLISSDATHNHLCLEKN